jgi:hypothetical protein
MDKELIEKEILEIENAMALGVVAIFSSNKYY